jgi:HAD superfamily hydrolase (TIGR01549 family)
MRVETLFLDAGGVLVFPSWRRVAETFRRHGVEVDAAKMAAVEPYVRRELDTARAVTTTTDGARAETYWARILDLAGVSIDEAVRTAGDELRAYHAAHNLWELVPDDVAPALSRCRDHGLRMAVVSNANGTVRAKLERLGLARFFETIVDSTEEGIEKPDPGIFRVALDRVGGRAETTLHVGDLYHVDVVGARSAGLRAGLLDPLGLYPDADVERFSSLAALAEAVTSL